MLLLHKNKHKHKIRYSQTKILKLIKFKFPLYNLEKVNYP